MVPKYKMVDTQYVAHGTFHYVRLAHTDYGLFQIEATATVDGPLLMRPRGFVSVRKWTKSGFSELIAVPIDDTKHGARLRVDDPSTYGYAWMAADDAFIAVLPIIEHL